MQPVRSISDSRSSSSHWRKSPLKPMLSAIWNVEMTHRSICLPDFGSFAGSAILPPGLIEGQIGHVRRVPIEVGPAALSGLLYLINKDCSVHYRDMSRYSMGDQELPHLPLRGAGTDRAGSAGSMKMLTAALLAFDAVILGYDLLQIASFVSLWA